MFIDRALEKTNHIRRLTDDLFAFEENCRTLPLDTYNGQELLAQVSSSINNFLTSNRFRLDYADQTTVTVQLVKDKSAVPDMSIAVTDKNDNYASGKTDKAGQITVPTGSGKTNEDGKVTTGYEDADGDRWTLTVKVIRTDTKRPISGSAVSIGKTGNITVKLPDGTDLDAKHQVTVIVTDHKKAPQQGKNVTVKGDLGQSAAGKTDKNGEIYIEGLRIGEYTVSEVNDSVSAGYILPADKQATVKVGATTIVEMHNEFRDTPKTGDDFNLALWVSLAAASVLGAGVLGFIGFKKKKKED